MGEGGIPCQRSPSCSASSIYALGRNVSPDRTAVGFLHYSHLSRAKLTPLFHRFGRAWPKLTYCPPLQFEIHRLVK